MPYASILDKSSKVKMYKYTHSSTASKSCLGVSGGSRGDAHAMVEQLAMMVSRMSGSNIGCSTIRMASERGQW